MNRLPADEVQDAERKEERGLTACRRRSSRQDEWTTTWVSAEHGDLIVHVLFEQMDPCVPRQVRPGQVRYLGPNRGPVFWATWGKGQGLA
jgi:hypothetical protein